MTRAAPPWALWALPLVAALGAPLLLPAGGQERGEVAPSLDAAISRTLPRVVRAAAPHLVRIHPDVPGEEARRRTRSGVVIRPGVVVTCASNVETFGVDDLVVETADGRTVPALPRGRDLRLRLVVLVAPELDAPPIPRGPDEVDPGALVLALGAALGEDLSAPLEPEAPVHWTELPELAAERVSERFALPLVRAATPASERRRILGLLDEGALRAVVSVEVLDEGWDVPGAKLGLVLGSSRSGGVRQHQQRLGRILRRQGDRVASLFEVVVADTHEFFTSQRRGKAVRTAADRQLGLGF